MSRWFRLYDEVLDDPKVQRLPERIFKTWINILCAASRNGGIIPPLKDLAFLLRRDEAKLFTEIAALSVAGLLDDSDGKVTPHNWKGRQFQSDGSTERVKRFRERSADASGNVTATANETPPEAETEQNRADADKKSSKSPFRKKRANGASVWVTMDDAQWPAYRAAHLAETGTEPPHKGGLNGTGWWFKPLAKPSAPTPEAAPASVQ